MEAEGSLFVVATPIGNLEDITLRALRILREVDVVLSEDTRHSRILLEHYSIDTRLESLHAHTRSSRIDQLIERLAEGAWFALISDAGTPLVSDPGAELVKKATSQGVRVHVIPGPSAVITSVVASALPMDRFRFMGFLSRAGAKRKEDLQTLTEANDAVVFFESPHRLLDTLRDLQKLTITRSIAVCREMTKLHEEVVRGPIADVIALLETLPRLRGETTVVLQARSVESNAKAAPALTTNVDERIKIGLAAGTPTKLLARQLQAELNMPRHVIYQRILNLKSG